jgi:hypothetical protein
MRQPNGGDSGSIVHFTSSMMAAGDDRHSRHELDSVHQERRDD